MTKLIHGECLKELKTIPDKSIDFILTDIPYGTTACKWDAIIPFEPMWAELNRVIKTNGAIALFGSEPFSSALRMSNIKNYKYDWIWQKAKGSGFFNAHRRPLKNHEIISIFYKKQPTYNPQFTEGQPYSNKQGYVGEYLSGGKPTVNRVETVNDGFRYPVSIQKFKMDIGYHPTQKPVALLEYLIKTYTNEGETVLDFTMGSGSTGVACVNTNRDFIGIELEHDYYQTAKERVAKAQALKDAV